MLKRFLPVTLPLLLYQQVKNNVAIWAGQPICLHQTAGGEGLGCPTCMQHTDNQSVEGSHRSNTKPVVADPGYRNVPLFMVVYLFQTWAN